MHDPKLYRLVRDADKNKREQALVTLIEGDYKFWAAALSRKVKSKQ
jgi:hypothetical protein